MQNIMPIHPRSMNEDETKVDQLIPISDDHRAKKVMSSPQMRAAVMSIMRKKLVWTGMTGCLNQIRNLLFSDNYQLNRCLSSRGGGGSRVREMIICTETGLKQSFSLASDYVGNIWPGQHKDWPGHRTRN